MVQMAEPPAPYLQAMVGWRFLVIRHPAYQWVRLRADYEHVKDGPGVELILAGAGNDHAHYFEAT